MQNDKELHHTVNINMTLKLKAKPRTKKIFYAYLAEASLIGIQVNVS